MDARTIHPRCAYCGVSDGYVRWWPHRDDYLRFACRDEAACQERQRELMHHTPDVRPTPRARD